MITLPSQAEIDSVRVLSFPVSAALVQSRSQSFRRRTVGLDRNGELTCSCPARVTCWHLRATAAAVAQRVLEISGATDEAQMLDCIRRVIEDLSDDEPAIFSFLFYANSERVSKCRLGYMPDSQAEFCIAIAQISMSEFEKQCCLLYLRGLSEQIAGQKQCRIVSDAPVEARRSLLATV